MPTAPAEGNEKPLDVLNPVDIAKFGYEKTLTFLRKALGVKEARTNELNASTEKSKIFQKSIEQRHKLAMEISPKQYAMA
ncbi:MAG: hypothetical protein KBA40_02730 [Candidatus Peribacteraceae bacterium]|nr:hypothetical protein [Candidatus Peribacteraceae bacterium]MBP9851013.1 hypothetical protein [Candidatus Peribacteraceae bacterium]